MPPQDAATEPCPRCDGRGWVVEDDGAAGTARPCDCRGAERVREKLRRARIPERYRKCTLESFNSQSHDPRDREQLFAAHAECRAYVDGFLRSDGGYCDKGLLLVGPPGTGKTHLAAAVLQEVISRYGVDGLFVDFTTLVHDIQATFDAAVGRSKSEVLDPVMNVRLLVLDELAAQKPSPWVNDTLYLIMNGRYTRKLPTIFTTNFGLAASSATDLDRPQREDAVDLSARIPARLVSRLYEMARPVEIAAGDYRKDIKRYQSGS